MNRKDLEGFSGSGPTPSLASAKHSLHIATAGLYRRKNCHARRYYIFLNSSVRAYACRSVLDRPCWPPHVSMRCTRPFASAHRRRRRNAWVSAPWSAITSPPRYAVPVSQSLTIRRTRYRGFCFTAAELADAAVDRVASEPEAAEQAPRPRFGRWRMAHAADLLEEGAGEVELLRLLGEVADGQVLAAEHGARIRLLASDQDLEEGRLAGAVRTDQAELVPLRELQVDVREEEAAAVRFRDGLEAHDPRTRGALAEREAERTRCGRRRFWRLAAHPLDPQLAGEHLFVH